MRITSSSFVGLMVGDTVEVQPIGSHRSRVIVIESLDADPDSTTRFITSSSGLTLFESGGHTVTMRQRGERVFS